MKGRRNASVSGGLSRERNTGELKALQTVVLVDEGLDWVLFWFHQHPLLLVKA